MCLFGEINHESRITVKFHARQILPIKRDIPFLACIAEAVAVKKSLSVENRTFQQCFA